MNGWSVVAAIGTSIGSLLVIIKMLWGIAASITIMSASVVDNTNELIARSDLIASYNQQLATLNSNAMSQLKVEYVDTEYIIVSLPAKYGGAYAKVPMVRLSVADSLTNKSSN